MISAQNKTIPTDIPNQPHPLTSWPYQNIIATHLLRLVPATRTGAEPVVRADCCPRLHCSPVQVTLLGRRVQDLWAGQPLPGTGTPARAGE
ncbi:hypothetical protein GCM10010254_21570 [Streptomyces chromofuscus]|nr:hypothetical protein GCM10010254_21570 [Streptomyces chromofuscus]